MYVNVGNVKRCRDGNVCEVYAILFLFGSFFTFFKYFVHRCAVGVGSKLLRGGSLVKACVGCVYSGVL